MKVIIKMLIIKILFISFRFSLDSSQRLTILVELKPLKDQCFCILKYFTNYYCLKIFVKGNDQFNKCLISTKPFLYSLSYNYSKHFICYVFSSTTYFLSVIKFLVLLQLRNIQCLIIVIAFQLMCAFLRQYEIEATFLP